MDALVINRRPAPSPAWRMYRALELAEHRPRPLPPQATDDVYVRDYRQFLIDLAATRGEDERMTALYDAAPLLMSVFTRSFDPQRYVLEAWILSNASATTIADYFGVSEAAIEYFEKLVFDVRDRRHDRSWMAKVIGRLPQTSPRSFRYEDDLRGYVLRLVGYHGGPDALQAILEEENSWLSLAHRSNFTTDCCGSI